MSTLLITSAIDLSKAMAYQVELIDTDIRLTQYIDSIKFAINHYSCISHIVFCDNTNYRFDYTQLTQFAQAKGKTLEMLSFEGDFDKIEKLGKGFGEGELIKYALMNSKTLNSCDYFYKLTGRLFIKNMDAVIRFTKSPNAFIYYPSILYQNKFDYVNTIFYKVEKNLYLNVLLDSHIYVNDLKYIYLENIFFSKLKYYPLKSFGIFPIISGQSGSTGLKYDLSSFKLFIELNLNYLGIHNIKKTYLAKSLTFLFARLRNFDFKKNN